jgi:hypothetical protein
MKKMLICCLVLASCSPPAPPPPAQKPAAAVKKEAVVLEGTAKNAKAGAVLETSDKTVSLHGLAAWPADTLGKRVTMKGELHTIPPAPATLDAMGNVVQAILTPQYVLHGHSKIEPGAPK